MVAKAQRGVCCLAGCEKKSECETGGGFLDAPPVLCEEHLADPTRTHLGEWCLLEAHHRFEQWSCCRQGYKLTICGKFRDAISPYAHTIPHTPEQEEKRNAVIAARQAEAEWWERQNAGNDSYDR
eukprot:gene25725-31064_t